MKYYGLFSKYAVGDSLVQKSNCFTLEENVLKSARGP